jgi:hypothetical protein
MLGRVPGRVSGRVLDRGETDPGVVLGLHAPESRPAGDGVLEGVREVGHAHLEVQLHRWPSRLGGPDGSLVGHALLAGDRGLPGR